AKGLQQVKEIQATCSDASNEYLRRLTNALNPCTYIADKIVRELMENPAPTTAKGNYIADGVHAELDELRSIASTGKEYLVKLQQEEAAKTGIPSLKIGFNNVFGYY
ncbi:DNA mismatch repair protein MutS, partial [Flavihumibacter sediminis]|nr:DNA mismatch repair protein MutS [Flavihumibacter sediminis]